MKRVPAFLIALIFVVVCQPAWAGTEDNATPSLSKPVQDQPVAGQNSVAKPGQAAPDQGTAEKAGQDVIGKFPLDIQSKGSDQSGTLLSYKLKEEVISSRLFQLTASEKKKFVMHIMTQPEFPDRPGIASQYSIVLVYQEDVGTLTYFLGQYQGQVHPEAVPAEMRKILEWAYANLKRFHYLLDE